jgi:hypothetical protein
MEKYEKITLLEKYIIHGTSQNCMIYEVCGFLKVYPTIRDLRTSMPNIPKSVHKIIFQRII